MMQNPIKVVHLSTLDRVGGAARAAYRLHRALLKEGLHSRMLVSRLSEINDETVIPTKKSFFGKILSRFPEIDQLPLRLYQPRPATAFSTNLFQQFKVKKQKILAQADIIALYWTGYSFLTPKQLTQFHKPLIWRLSDTWPLTGGCHYPGTCTRYEKDCGFCPQLGSKHKRDLSHFIWRKKKQHWEKIALTIVAPSHWIADRARKSSLFYNKIIKIIPTGVEINIFRPHDKQTARRLLGMKADKKYILFGAVKATSDARKGFIYLQQALQILKTQLIAEQVEIIIFGASEPLKIPDFGFVTHYQGVLQDEVSLALLYSAADVFIAPSLEDNLPNTILESMACGTPVVAFQIGGIPEVVEHLRNGFLTPSGDSHHLAQGIKMILEDNKTAAAFSLQAREKILAGFTLDQQAKEYVDLYQKIKSS